MTRNLMLMTLILAASLPAQVRRTPVNRTPRAAYSPSQTGNPAVAIVGQPGEPWRYASYNGYTIDPPTAPPTQYPGADQPYSANAACDSAVMQQNGFHVVKNNGRNQCRWEKAKNWPGYQYQAPPRQAYQPPDASAVNRMDPSAMGGRVAVPPDYSAVNRMDPTGMAGRVSPLPRAVPPMTQPIQQQPNLWQRMNDPRVRQLYNIGTGRVLEPSIDDALQNAFGRNR